ncbi:MAG: transglycosylase SLT domain-containing protein [Proteobacteria bacterium]|nr:transglycosylase SLT domain-containing protein [Pseudomonadota bacterium]
MRYFLVLLFMSFQLVAGGSSALAAGTQADAAANNQATQRDDYGEATAAIRRGGWSDFEQLRSGLDNYPLAVYLDYYKLSGQPARVRPAEARRFIDLSQDTPLPNRFLGVYLHRAGKDRRWKDFLQVMPEEPNAIELKCYYFRARLSEGDTLAAWEGAERLWVYGKSRPKECDPLFTAWLKAGELSDEVVWARLLEAFGARQKSLMTYVARKGSAELKPWSDKLLAVYSRPDHMQRQTLLASSPYSSDIASYGVAYLARYNPEKALQVWLAYQDQLSFDEAQVNRAEYAIALRSLYNKTEQHIDWLEQALVRLNDDKLVEIRLRWALGQRDWSAVSRTIPQLSEKRAGDAVWRYWRALSRQELGEREQAQKDLADIALERGYYGFLAADKLGKAYVFNNSASAAPPLVSSARPIAQLPVVVRIEELYFHEEDQPAHSEWFKVLQDSDAPRQESLASYAAEQGWHRMAIDGANTAKAWDRLDLRFPMPYQDTFNHYASLQKIPSTELMAIARRESAFFPAARSPVGARGLMQLMPATGKQVARSLGKTHQKSDLYEVDHNVLLGSAYYKQLLDRYDGNRVFAIAAYNAGPHRVDQWRNKTGEAVSVEIWVATIPFRETRNYVQAVLSYNVVFHHLLGVDRSLLTMAELQADY